MAPTELLAEQHFATVERLTQGLAVRSLLLTGRLGRGERERARAAIAAGEVDVVLGTHALIQEGVRFARLGLGVVDEQHRFGVMQRAAVKDLGPDGHSPHILLMSATPIPRTLALTLYGDLDVSVLDELPPGRQPVRTRVVKEASRPQLYERVKTEVAAGRQAYVVFPLVEAAEKDDLRDATGMARELTRTVFADCRVGLLHGRMKAEEKDAVMRRFRDGDVQVLVSTTVIEVGVDVPNATVMVVEHAERFGLAQLHQLRGRVGRGSQASMCFLVASRAAGSDAAQRLRAMERTNDGFKLAEADLRLRGPGEFLGTRQSGLPDFRVANLLRDSRLLVEARRAAEQWLARDPDLSGVESAGMREILRARWAGRLGLGLVG
jgi:ATP-dependent DNA helicase RecG